jgi:hypothetical protein
MHHRARDITGMKLFSLTAISYAGSDGKKSLWLFRCDCGKEFIMPATEFLKERQKSCGCQKLALISKANSTHRMSTHPAYFVWRSMKDRCTLPTHQAWENYGGRGIRVCQRWLDSFEAFWEDMGPTYKRGLTLDRKNVNGNYTPENCRWVSMKTQGRNKRNNQIINTQWGRITISEASEISGIGVTTLCYRLAAGWPENLLFAEPDVTNRFMTS